MAEATLKSGAEQIPVMTPALHVLSVETDISIVIVTWNSERWIERCLRSLPAACDGVKYEVLVYDNASSDATLSLLDIGEDTARVIRGDANDGFAAGVNRAFSGSRGRYVFLLNPDCELGPSAVTLLARFLDENRDAAAAAPLLEDESGDTQRNFQLRRLPTLRALAAEALLLDKLFPRNRATSHYRYHDLELREPQRVEQPAAAALLVRREVFDEIGPLDEQFSPAWFEDVDYCRRLAQAGKALYVVPAARVRHYGGASLEHMSYGSFINLYYRNMWRYARKWFSRGEANTLRWTVALGMALRCAAALVGFKNGSSSRWAALAAYATVLKKAVSRWDET
jgi:GT2 family glycosyltransferase